MAHEAAHYVSALLFAGGNGFFDKWMDHPDLAPKLSQFMPFQEAFPVAVAEINRYTQPAWNGWAREFGPWPDQWTKRFTYDPDTRRTHYQYGLPLAYLIRNNAAPTLCEFWSNPELPLALQVPNSEVDESVLSIMDIDWDVYAGFRHKWAVPGLREQIEPGLTAIPEIGDASELPLTPALIDGGPWERFVSHDLAGICNGGTLRLDFSTEGFGDQTDDVYSFHHASDAMEHEVYLARSWRGSDEVIVGANPSAFTSDLTLSWTGWNRFPVNAPDAQAYVTMDKPSSTRTSGFYLASKQGTEDGPRNQCQ